MDYLSAEALVIKVADYSHRKNIGYWEAVRYLASVEREFGTRAALFELALARALDNKVSELKAAAAKKARRSR